MQLLTSGITTWEKSLPNSIKVGRRDNLGLGNSLTFQFISHFLVEILLCQAMGKMNLFHMWHMITHSVEVLWHPGFGLSYLNRLTAKSWFSLNYSHSLTKPCKYVLISFEWDSKQTNERITANLLAFSALTTWWSIFNAGSDQKACSPKETGSAELWSCSWNVVWPLLLQRMWSVQGISSYNKKKLAKR